MGKKATKKSVEQLQKFFDFLGEFGGTIETKKPENWWKFDLEVEFADDTSKDIMIGIYTTVNGDIAFDPQFTLKLKMDGNTIVDAEINNCVNQTMMGYLEVDANDMFHGMGRTEKADPGLTDLFSNFMHNITEIGPYLTDPLKVEKYEKTLAE